MEGGAECALPGFRVPNRGERRNDVPHGVVVSSSIAKTGDTTAHGREEEVVEGRDGCP